MNNCKFYMFLDLDGVMSPSNHLIQIHNKLNKYELENQRKEMFSYINFMQHYCFSYNAIQFLNDIYDSIPYNIVLTSTRRYEFSIAEWNTIFKINKIKAPIVGRTDKYSKTENHFIWREDEIEKYITDYNLSEYPYIVIDDDVADLLNIKDHLINVNTDTGLTMNYIQLILRLLILQGLDVTGGINNES